MAPCPLLKSDLYPGIWCTWGHIQMPEIMEWEWGSGGSPKENPGVVAWRNKKGKWVEGRAGTNNRALQAPLPHTPASCAGAQGRASCPLPFSRAREAQAGALGTFGHSSQMSAFLPGSLLTTTSVFVFTELFYSCFIWRPQRGKDFWFLNCTFFFKLSYIFNKFQ